MPVLAALLASIFGGIVTFFTQVVTKRVAIVLAAITLLATVTAVMVTGIDALISGIATAVPTDLQIGASWILPSNFSACIGAVISGHLLRWAYDYNTKIIQYKLF